MSCRLQNSSRVDGHISPLECQLRHPYLLYALPTVVGMGFLGA
jgi:hypothetical protein